MAESEESLVQREGQMIEVTGVILSKESDENSRTISLGMNEMEVVVCQMDNRYLEKSAKLNKGHFVKLKGKLSGHDFDELLGKTIQMKNCVLSTQKK